MLGYKLRTQFISRIIIHHTGGGDLQNAIDTLNQKGLSYHYIINIDGEVKELVEPVKYVAYHAGNANSDSIGISLVGNFIKTDATKEQKESLHILINKLTKEIPTIKEILRHKDVGATECPGNFDILPYKDIQKIKIVEKEKNNIIIDNPSQVMTTRPTLSIKPKSKIFNFIKFILTLILNKNIKTKEEI